MTTTFTDTKFMTAAEKQRVLRQWTTFLKHGLKWEHFTKPIYHHLIQHCSFIAHYDRGGFYHAYFGEDRRAARRFLRQFDLEGDRRSVEYCGLWWLDGDYADINAAMCHALEPYKKALYARLAREERERDLATARALLARHGMELPPLT